ncbi:MAG TPA: SDR family oxidoreductase [Ktedonosporobacter sp.]|nr:SDR family oxidoreductase [Ktedonosporobacter sp.]
MDESSKELGLHGKNVVVIGGSRGLGRALVAAAHAEGAQVLAVARQEAELRKVAEERSGVQVLALDATYESAPARVFAALSPDVLLLCAGAVPHMAPLGEQNWEQFSRNWNTDVKIALFFLQAALNTPLPEGSTIVLISSRAAIGGSSPSGGYAGSKRMLMFLAKYAQEESDRLHLGLRILALAPGNIMAETDVGKAAAAAYAASRGLSIEDFLSLQRGGQPLVTPDLVANALVELARDPQKSAGKSLLLSGKGLEIVP